MESAWLLLLILLLTFFLVKKIYTINKFDALSQPALEAVEKFQKWESQHHDINPTTSPEAQILIKNALLVNAAVANYRAMPPMLEYVSYMKDLLEKLADKNSFYTEHKKEIDLLLYY